MNFVGEDLEAMAAAVLGLVERGVGMVHQRFGIHLVHRSVSLPLC